MSLNDWAKSGWLKPQQPTRDQIAKIFGVVDRDIEDSKRTGICFSDTTSELAFISG